MLAQLEVTSLLLLLALTACERSKSTSHAPPFATAAATSVSAATASAVAPAAPPSGAAPALGSSATTVKTGLVHCKAIGKRGLVSIGVIREELIDLVTEGDGVFAFGYQRELARLTLRRFPRDGAPPTVIGRHTGAGEPKSPVLTADAAYFTRNKTLYRLPRSGGEPVELAKGFSGSIAVQGQYVYGFACDPKHPPDHLQRVGTEGGPVESIASIERVRSQEEDTSSAADDYRSLAADAQAIYATNWNGRRVLRISLTDRSVTELATKKAFPTRLQSDGDQLLFQTATGLFRVSKTQADAKRISELGSSPFSFIAHSGPVTFIHQCVPYGTEEWTYELTRASGQAKKLEYYKAVKPDETPPDVGIRGLAVDDECLYTARQLEKYMVLYARSRG